MAQFAWPELLIAARIPATRAPPSPAEQAHHDYYTPTVTAQHIPLKTQLASSLPLRYILK
jgi:hypothetical protein